MPITPCFAARIDSDCVHENNPIHKTPIEEKLRSIKIVSYERANDFDWAQFAFHDVRSPERILNYEFVMSGQFMRSPLTRAKPRTTTSTNSPLSGSLIFDSLCCKTGAEEPNRSDSGCDGSRKANCCCCWKSTRVE